MSGHPIPIETIDNIDVIVPKKDGTVELKIIAAGYLDGSDETIDRLITKINNYLDSIHTEEFQADFGPPSSEKIKIILHCAELPHETITELLDSIQEQVERNKASISLDVKS